MNNAETTEPTTFDQGDVGRAALGELIKCGRVSHCDERLLEKLLRRTLNHTPDWSLSLTSGVTATWFAGAAGWLPDLMAQTSAGAFAAGIEVKTRANINWGYYGSEVWQSQLDRYADRVSEIGGEAAPLYLLVSSTNQAKVKTELAGTGDAEVRSKDRWEVITLDKLLALADPDPASRVTANHPAVELLTSLLTDQP